MKLEKWMEFFFGFVSPLRLVPLLFMYYCQWGHLSFTYWENDMSIRIMLIILLIVESSMAYGNRPVTMHPGRLSSAASIHERSVGPQSKFRLFRNSRGCLYILWSFNGD